METTVTAISIHPAFRWPDVVTVRTARKPHECEMPRENGVVEQPTPTGGVRLVQAHPDRPMHFRRWDGGAIPDGHTPTIHAGEQYVEYFGEAPAYQAGQRYCRACAIAAGIAVEVS